MLKPLATQILNDIQYATLATTASNGAPWNTPVFYAFDKDINIYWSSHPGSVHSQNLTSNSKVFIVIYNSKAAEGEGVGLYVQAEASVVDNIEEIHAALQLLGERRGKPFLHPEKFIQNGPQRIYKAKPMQCWTNDATQDGDGDFIKDFRVTATQ